MVQRLLYTIYYTSIDFIYYTSIDFADGGFQVLARFLWWHRTDNSPLRHNIHTNGHMNVIALSLYRWRL